MTQNRTHSYAATIGRFLWRATCFIFRSVVTLITLGILVVFFFAAYSDLFNPQQFVHVAFFGIAFSFILAGAILWFVVLLCSRQWILALIMLGAMCWAHEPIGRLCPLHISNNGIVSHTNMGASADTIRLLSYNTCAMGQTRLSKIDEEIPVLDMVLHSDADIVCLQEYAFTLSKGGHTEQQIRQYLADEYPYYHYMPYHNRKAMGLALFSRFPIVSAKRIDPAPKQYFASMYYVLDIHGQRVALVNNHLKSNNIEPADREFYSDMIEHFEKDSLSRIKQNLLYKLAAAYKERAKQSDHIAAFVRQEHPMGYGADMPALICGDFNDTPISYCYRTIRGSLHDAWQDAGLGLGITYHQHYFWFHIDHIFYSRHFHAIDCQVLRQYKYSDHYPILATFQILPDSDHP